jgi:hypothetical protein
VQLEPEQTCPLPQLVPHAPQFDESLLKFTHASPQRTVPATQVPTHSLAEQLKPLPQTWPHAPQLLGSFATSLQVPLHEICPAAQAPPSELPPLPPPPASGVVPMHVPPSQVTVGVQVMSWPQTPTELRPQLGVANATNSSRIVASKLAGSGDGRWTRIV